MARIKKQILKTGVWDHPSAPNGKLEITKQYLQDIYENFKYSPFAPATRGHQELHDIEKDPSLKLAKNIEGLSLEEDKLYAIVDIPEDELNNYNDVSAGIIPNYYNKELKKHTGPALEHLAFVMNPFIKGMEDFVKLSDNPESIVITLSDIKDMAEKDPTKEEKKEELTEEVKETETKTDPEKGEETKTEPEAGKEGEGKEGDEPGKTEPTVTASDTDLQKQVIKLQEELAQKNAQIAKQDAETKYKTLLSEGKLIPAQKDAFLALAEQSGQVIKLSDNSEKTVGVLLDEFFAKSPKLINLEEQGINLEDGAIKVEGEDEQLKKLNLEEIRKIPENVNLSDEDFAKKVKENIDVYSKYYLKK